MPKDKKRGKKKMFPSLEKVERHTGSSTSRQCWLRQLSGEMADPQSEKPGTAGQARPRVWGNSLGKHSCTHVQPLSKWALDFRETYRLGQSRERRRTMD